MTQNRHLAGTASSMGGKFGPDQHQASTVSLDSGLELTGQTPSEVDGALAPMMNVTARAQSVQARIRLAIAKNAENLSKVSEDSYDAVYRYVPANEKYEADLVNVDADVRAALLAEQPYHDEFDRRGGWTRAYLAVTNSDGHVHNTTGCPSCNNGQHPTQFAWLTDYSGHDETKVIDDAGDAACAYCFPAQIIDGRRKGPSRIVDPQRTLARSERAAKKAASNAAKAAKAIANPDGTPLRGQHGRIDTEHTAWIELVDLITGTLAYGYDAHPDVQARIVDALTHKGLGSGQSVDEARAAIGATLNVKLIAKYKAIRSETKKFAASSMFREHYRADIDARLVTVNALIAGSTNA
jgi:hypothetical protein